MILAGDAGHGATVDANIFTFDAVATETMHREVHRTLDRVFGGIVIEITEFDDILRGPMRPLRSRQKSRYRRNGSGLAGE